MTIKWNNESKERIEKAIANGSRDLSECADTVLSVIAELPEVRALVYWMDQLTNHGPLNSEDYRMAQKALQPFTNKGE